MGPQVPEPRPKKGAKTTFSERELKGGNGELFAVRWAGFDGLSNKTLASLVAKEQMR